MLTSWNSVPYESKNEKYLKMKFKSKILITLIASIGFFLLLTIFLWIISKTEYNNLLPYLSVYTFNYILSNTLIFTFIFSLFYRQISRSNFKNRIVYVFIIYVLFLIIGSVTTALLHAFHKITHYKMETSLFLSEFGEAIAYICITILIIPWVAITFGILIFGFIEGIYYLVLKKIEITTSIKKIPYIFLGIVVSPFILVSIIALQPNFKYHKTEKIPNTSLQAVIYLQDNFKSISIGSSDASYALSYFELQGNTLAKQFFFNRCKVMIGELYFQIEDNKLYFTKFSYIDLIDYSYHCFGNGM